MTSSTSPLLATLLLSHPLFSIPPGQTLSITLFSSILSLPLLFPRSVSLLSPALRHPLPPRSPDMTSGMGRPSCEMSKIHPCIIFFLSLIQKFKFLDMHIFSEGEGLHTWLFPSLSLLPELSPPLLVKHMQDLTFSLAGAQSQTDGQL